ncbi:unnamed protein product [Lepeophtheirus salmonis]|uniref:(salmon louse) hypothetical protein n=1 Tax=Lepeophtheirus salmonis TaxID=72036 RepID=A0A7R8CZK3_LEPSM|nr:unnamed protein product [Lepeophtheirus salmonis]CAF2935295.1 unnamed protein product [Lepeophtheirus salmonis]
MLKNSLLSSYFIQAYSVYGFASYLWAIMFGFVFVQRQFSLALQMVKSCCIIPFFIFAGVGVIAGIALGVHLVLEKGESSRENFRLGWGTIGTFYVLIGIIFCTNLYFYWTSQRRMRRQLVYNKSMQHFQVNFDLFVKFLIVIGPCAEPEWPISLKNYFCYDACCFGCCKQEEFINENCQELATIDSLKLREEKESNDFPNTSTFLLPDTNRQISRSLFNIRNGNGNNSTLDRSELDPLNPDADESIGKNITPS